MQRLLESRKNLSVCDCRSKSDSKRCVSRIACKFHGTPINGPGGKACRSSGQSTNSEDAPIRPTKGAPTGGYIIPSPQCDDACSQLTSDMDLYVTESEKHGCARREQVLNFSTYIPEKYLRLQTVFKQSSLSIFDVTYTSVSKGSRVKSRVSCVRTF